MEDAEIRNMLADGLHELDKQLEARIRRAVEREDLEISIDPALLARLACGIMNSIAVRARAGESRAILKATAEAGVRLICGES